MEASGQVGNSKRELAGPAISSMPVEGIHTHQQEAQPSRTGTLEKSFSVMLEANQKIIHTACRLYSTNREDDQDLFQEISFQLWKAYPKFEGKSLVSTWVYSIALKTGAMMARQKQKRFERSDEVPEIPVHPHYDGHDSVLDYLRRLSITDRAIVTLKMDGYSQEEIATILEITYDAVRMRLSRLREKW